MLFNVVQKDKHISFLASPTLEDAERDLALMLDREVPDLKRLGYSLEGSAKASVTLEEMAKVSSKVKLDEMRLLDLASSFVMAAAMALESKVAYASEANDYVRTRVKRAEKYAGNLQKLSERTGIDRRKLAKTLARGDSLSVYEFTKTQSVLKV